MTHLDSATSTVVADRPRAARLPGPWLPTLLVGIAWASASVSVTAGCGASNTTGHSPSGVTTTDPADGEPSAGTARTRQQRACAGGDGPTKRSLAAGELFDAAPAGDIGAVELRGLGAAAKAQLLAQLETRAAAAIDAATVREDIQRLWASGKVEDVRVWTSTKGGQLRVVFEVVQRRQIGEVFFVGLETLSPAEVRGHLRLEPAASFDPAQLHSQLVELRQHYASLGFHRVQATASHAPADVATVDVCIRVDEGPHAQIRQLELVGNAKLSTQELLAQIDTQGGQVNVVGGVYDELRLERDVLRMSALYLDRGMVAAKFAPVQVELSEDGRELGLRIEVEEGPVYRVGTVGFTGDLLADPKAYRKLVPIAGGDLVSRSKLQAGIAAIVAFHADRMRPGAHVEPLTAIDQAKKVVDITLQIACPAPTP